uniref:Transmembrane protein n=1 Tax=Cucumis sativus TaxID=3659 RepID=A0A0A0K5X8_CUCSA
MKEEQKKKKKKEKIKCHLISKLLQSKTQLFNPKKSYPLPLASLEAIILPFPQLQFLLFSNPKLQKKQRLLLTSFFIVTPAGYGGGLILRSRFKSTSSFGGEKLLITGFFLSS